MCFCEYTDHGHCGIINQVGSEQYSPSLGEGYLLNEPTLHILGRASVVHAQAGADIIAPSGMIDGMVSGIRHALDESGFQQVPIAAYQVSGEYAMLHAAALNGWMDLRRTALESLISIKRAGADMILSYFAKDAVRWLED